jgi:hypothetical protein
MSNYDPRTPDPRRSPASTGVGLSWLWLILIIIVIFGWGGWQSGWWGDGNRTKNALTAQHHETTGSGNATSTNSTNKPGTAPPAPSR